MADVSASTEEHDRAPVLDTLIALTCGSPPRYDVAPMWADVLSLARRERCVALAWWRSRESIIALAPGDISNRWRVIAASVAAAAMRQLSDIALIDAAFQQHGVEAAVMKGPTLSQSLYGDIAVRVPGDIDFCVQPTSRPAAHRVLIELGWDHRRGWSPEEAVYCRGAPGSLQVVELHSILLDDRFAIRSRLPLPEWEWGDFGGFSLRAARGAVLLPFLAVELAIRGGVRVASACDFLAAWKRLSASERAAVRGLSSKYRLEKYLSWACRISEVLENAGGGDSRALRELKWWRQETQLSRHLRLAGSRADAAHALLHWIAPEFLRGDRGSWWNLWRWRGRRILDLWNT